jgi:hypothetical protein
MRPLQPRPPSRDALRDGSSWSLSAAWGGRRAFSPIGPERVTHSMLAATARREGVTVLSPPRVGGDRDRKSTSRALHCAPKPTGTSLRWGLPEDRVRGPQVSPFAARSRASRTERDGGCVRGPPGRFQVGGHDGGSDTARTACACSEAARASVPPGPLVPRLVESVTAPVRTA